MPQVIDIKGGTTVDGPGLRTSIYFAGCSHHCPGCHNPQTWDPQAGTSMSIDEIIAEIKEQDFNVTFTGGDPLYQLDEITQLAERIKAETGKTIWCYTGYKWEDIIGKARFNKLLHYIDVLVDSPFILEQRDISLRFRGSSNQRLINVKESIEQNQIVLY